MQQNQRPSIKELMNILPQTGTVLWIGIRPERRAPMQGVDTIQVSTESGLAGDHYGKNGGNRQVTLIQAEHLEAVAKMLQLGTIDPADTRRNIVVSGINLQAFTDRQFEIGEVVLEMTGICHPCSRFEESLGPGGYNTMRGHGGITAKVIQGGIIKKGDVVKLKQL